MTKDAETIKAQKILDCILLKGERKFNPYSFFNDFEDVFNSLNKEEKKTAIKVLNCVNNSIPTR